MKIPFNPHQFNAPTLVTNASTSMKSAISAISGLSVQRQFHLQLRIFAVADGLRIARRPGEGEAPREGGELEHLLGPEITKQHRTHRTLDPAYYRKSLW